ncbi:MAG: S8 family serine peptidase [Burkholderiales bacterium]|nr:S8 family serine peptidase [Burkholderiales bacterium]
MDMMHTRPRCRMRQDCCAVLVAVTALGLGLAAPAHAQLGVPRLSVPQVPAIPAAPVPLAVPQIPQAPPALPVPSVQPLLPTQPVLPNPSALPLPQTVQPLSPALDGLRTPGTLVNNVVTNAVPLQSLRASTVRDLLRLHADVLEVNRAGEPIRRQELLVISPTPAVLDAALAAGFVKLREQKLPELDLYQIVLRPPPGRTTAEALAQLRALDPQLEADFNHVYTGSGDPAQSTAAQPQRTVATAWRVGLVDSGVDAQHAALRNVHVHPWGCNGIAHPSPHGTTVAALLAGNDNRLTGDSALYAADIYCSQPASGTVEAIASALAWMAAENVAVINISLVGPSNRLLERAVQAMVRKGHVLVAAVGNDGPAAQPLYPAAYPGVVGVTAVSSMWRVLPEAAQGPHVMFAARAGTDAHVRGTSFAAPLVAALLAPLLIKPDPSGAASAVADLAKSAIDLGAPGRDPVFGWGLVGERAP